MEDVSGAAACGDAEEAEDSSGKKRKVFLPSFHLLSFFLSFFLPSFHPFLALHNILRPTNKYVLASQTARLPAKKLKLMSKAKKSKETIDEEDDEAED
jgi:hypothetical protein